ncbi:MAG: thiol-disulfide isomerase [Deltaproteobacteria bacterium]|nr:MAG: thiol-disulfide isomerase [Deltaproteobacteria bacterium]
MNLSLRHLRIPLRRIPIVCLLAMMAFASTSPARESDAVSLPLPVEKEGSIATVIVFLSTSCPISNKFVPLLNRLSERYEPKGIRFLGFIVSSHETALDVARYVRKSGLAFEVVKDMGGRMARALEAQRTPEVFLIDGRGRLRYRGRINDQHRLGFSLSRPTREDLQIAIEELLSDKEISVARTEAFGCSITLPQVARKAEKITYTREIARLIQRHCQPCHRPEGVASFLPFMTYEEVRTQAEMIKEVVVTRRMPPWFADPNYGTFSNDRRLTEREIDTFVTWVDSGMPKGAEQDLPPPRHYAGRWMHGLPDKIVEMEEPFIVPAEGVLDYQYFLVDPGLKEDVWLQNSEVVPGTAAVHHILVYLLPPGEFNPFREDGRVVLVGGAGPGELATAFPPDVGLRLPAHSRFLFEIHYTPTGKVERDRSAIGLTFADRRPRWEVHTNGLLNTMISIPPGAADFEIQKSFSFPYDIRVLSFMPHMHLRGKSWEYRVRYPNGRIETLLKIPNYDFNWQIIYHFADPPRIPRGSKILCIAHWDNSPNNPRNPDPSRRVTFGFQISDEMMNGWMNYIVEPSGSVSEEVAHDIDVVEDEGDRIRR